MTQVPLTDQEITDILRGAGFIDSASAEFLRMKLDGSTLIAGDEIFVYNQAKDTPALRAQLVAPPVQFQSKWFDMEAAQIANRPEIADRMCKSYYDNPRQARKFSEDGASCDACPFGPFVQGPMPGTNQARCQWKGDVGLRIVPEDGNLKGDEPVWTLTLPTTSMIEFRGTRKDPNGGSVSDKNFMFKLAKFAESLAEEWGVAGDTAVMMALAAYQAGGVVVDVRLPRMQNDDRSRSWNVIQFDPIHIEKDFASPEIAPDAAEGPAIDESAPRIVSGEVIIEGETL